MSVTYDDLVTAATVGVGRRPLTITGLAGPAGDHAGVLDPDPAAAALDAAALLDAARRAAGLAPTPIDLPPEAPADERPELSLTASELLLHVLIRGDRDLAAELLAAAAAAGFRAAAPDLTRLLGAGRDPALRAPVAAVLGARGRWLAAQQPEWSGLVAAVGAVPGDDAWEVGRPAERIAWLAARRASDPDAARDLLAAGWARETGDDRAALLATLATGLAAADEPFLEAALDDRKAEVRARARRLLAALPGSAFTARAVTRSRGVLRVEGRGPRRRLVVTLPNAPDAAAQRDGLTGASPRRRLGDRAWHLVQVIAATPLDEWTAGLGLDAATLTGLDVEGGFGGEVHTGWRIAARAQANGEWAQALLDARPADARTADEPVAGPDDTQLLRVLPPETRVARAVAALRRPAERSGPAGDVLSCPVPWPVELTDAVLEQLAARLRAADPGRPGEVVSALGRGIDLADPRDHVAFLRTLADRFRDRTAEVPAAGRWPAALDAAAAVLDLRHRFRRSLQEPN